MVSPQNPLKQSASDLLPDYLRMEMTRLALADEPRLKACDYEFHLPKPSYTWNTLQLLSRDFPQHEFVLMIGGDNWKLFPRWYHSDDILARYPIVIYPREDSPIDPATLPPPVNIINTELYNVSSTEIRRRIRQGEPVDHLIPAAILGRAQLYYH